MKINTNIIFPLIFIIFIITAPILCIRQNIKKDNEVERVIYEEQLGIIRPVESEGGISMKKENKYNKDAWNSYFYKNSMSEKLKLERDDIIYKINNVPVHNLNIFKNTIKQLHDGDSLIINLIRYKKKSWNKTYRERVKITLKTIYSSNKQSSCNHYNEEI